MKRNLKGLGVSLAAVLAMSTVAASGASAAGELFHLGQNSVFLTGGTVSGETPLLEVGGTGSEVVYGCIRSRIEGTVQGENGTTSKQITVHPTFEGPCLDSWGGNPTVDTHGCDFTLTSEYDANGHAKGGLECTAGKAIVVTSSVCTITINSFAHNTIIQGVHYINQGNTLRVQSTVERIPYTKSGPFCFLVPGDGHDAVYTDDVLVQATSYTNASMNSTTHTWTVTEGGEVGVSHS